MENEEEPSDSLMELVCRGGEAKATAGIGTDEIAKTPARIVETTRDAKVFVDLIDDIMKTSR